MYTISLNNIEFHSFHGFYQEENLIGNNFLVDIVVEISDKNQENLNDDLTATVNYETLYKIAKEEMSVPRKLLESVVKSIHDKIKLLSNNIHSIEVTLTKKHVPIEGMVGKAKVSYRGSGYRVSGIE